jgi:O-antigen/teichoic acid export membrane protein
MAGISLFVMIIMRVYCHKKYEECVFRPRKYYDKVLMKEMSGFAGWNFMTASSSMIGQYGLGLVLNHFFGTILNAAQGIANQLCGQLQVFSNTMLKVLNPVITKSEGARNRSLMLQASMSGCKFSFFLLAFFAIPFLIDADFIMKLWLKNVPEWGVVFFRFQVARVLIEQLTIVLGVSISAQGDIVGINKVKSILNIFPVAFTAILFYLGYSPYYMYIIWIFCWSILGGGANIFYARKKCNLSIRKYLHGVLNPCLGLFCIVFGTAYIPYIMLPVGIIRFLCIAIISILCLLILLWFFGLNKSEKQIIRRLAHIKY